MESVKKLGAPEDVQAVAVAARALFESQVDLVLLHYASAEHPAQKVFDWERSAVLKHAEKVERFFKGRDLPAERGQIRRFLKGAEIPVIQAARTRWWNGEHPRTGRWTGRTLGQDAKRADILLPEAKLAEFYELEYSPTCWGAHGSGLPGLRSRSPLLVVATCATQLFNVHRFALLNLREILEELGLFLKVVFDDFERSAERTVASIQLEEHEKESA